MLSGCRNEDPVYAQNRELIRILKAHEKLPGPGPDKYVIPGREGHLFYLEDLRAAVIKWAYLDFNVKLITALSARLAAKGVRLILLPVPTKVETYPELLSGRDVPDISPSKDLFLGRLDSARVEYLDLRRDFFQAKKSRRLYPLADTHWDEAAIRLAAGKLALKLGFRVLGTPPSPSPLALPLLPISDTVLTGVRADMALKFGFAGSDSARLQRVGDGKGGFYAEPDSAAILLYGDSFLNMYKQYSAHLGAHLARETGVCVRTIYSLTGFTQGPERIAALVAAYPGIKTVVWVFTSRTLMESIPDSR